MQVWFLILSKLRDGAVVARQAHNLKVGGFESPSRYKFTVNQFCLDVGITIRHQCQEFAVAK